MSCALTVEQSSSEEVNCTLIASCALLKELLLSSFKQTIYRFGLASPGVSDNLLPFRTLFFFTLDFLLKDLDLVLVFFLLSACGSGGSVTPAPTDPEIVTTPVPTITYQILLGF